VSCNLTDNFIIPEKLFIDAGFYPSFHLPIQLKIYKLGTNGYLTFRALDYDNIERVISSDSVSLTKSDFRDFFKALGTTSLLTIPNDTLQAPNDGIGVEAVVIQDDKTNKFKNRSADRESILVFVKAVMDLLNKKLPRQENYIEDVEGYFSTDFKAKIKSEQPFVAKIIINGHSSEAEKDLKDFFEKVPVDKPAVIDVRKFQFLANSLAPFFKSFDSTHPKLIWVDRTGEAAYLQRIGIDTAKIEGNLEIAITRIFK
jgi:hypothetical protein